MNLANRPREVWANTLASSYSTCDICSSSDILVHDDCFGWISDIWDFIGIKNNNSYDLVFYFSLIISKLAFSDLMEKQFPSSLACTLFSSEVKSHTP